MTDSTDLPKRPQMASPMAVSCSESLFVSQAKALAQQLDLPLLGVTDPKRVSSVPLLMHIDEQGLALRATGKHAPGPVRAEFASGKAGYRLAHGGGTGQLIAKAVGLNRSREPLTVLDATAGLGQDAFVLAGLGCQVTLLERSPVIHALLQDGLARGAIVTDVAEVLSRMRLIAADSIVWLTQAPEEPLADVIYLDPMFPHRDKSAEVKKEMQLFRPVVGGDPDAEDLLAAALPRARYRVVVKRSRRAPEIAGRKPSVVIEGKSSRYDVYTLQGLPRT